jgi:lipopolysaccharide/colanic/teichoic acid biosynthesis glycosyltransferase
VEADNRYIEHWSLMLDVRITLRTVIEVLRRRNAA